MVKWSVLSSETLFFQLCLGLFCIVFCCCQTKSCCVLSHHLLYFGELTTEFSIAYVVDLHIKKTAKLKVNCIHNLRIWTSFPNFKSPKLKTYICICKTWILLISSKLSINLYCKIYVSSTKKPSRKCFLCGAEYLFRHFFS